MSDLLKGGQGRSGNDVCSDAAAFGWALLAAGAVLAVLALPFLAVGCGVQKPQPAREPSAETVRKAEQKAGEILRTTFNGM